MKPVRLLLIVLVVATASLSACGSPIPQAKPIGVDVGMALAVGGRGDKGINDLSAGGLARAEHRLGVGIKRKNLDERGLQRARNLDRLAAQKYNPVIAVGDKYADELAAVAAKHPKTRFAILDSAIPRASNIVNITFAEEQGSYLMGMAAALKSKTDRLGFVGGADDERTRRYRAGFVAGAKSVTPNIVVTARYLVPNPAAPSVDPDNSPNVARGIAQEMLQQGADILYQVAGNSGAGVFDAVVTSRAQGEKNTWAIGSDLDQQATATEEQKRFILTSMVKRFDNLVYEFIDDCVHDRVPADGYRATIANHGMGYATAGGYITKYKIVDDLKRAEKAIVAGQIKVPATL